VTIGGKYVKTNWQEGVTPLGPVNFNHAEGQYDAALLDIQELAGGLSLQRQPLFWKLPVMPKNFVAAAVFDGDTMYCLGLDYGGAPNALFKFDLVTLQYTLLAAPPGSVDSWLVGDFARGRIYAGTGNSLYCYNVAGNTWATIVVTNNVAACGLPALANDKMLLVSANGAVSTVVNLVTQGLSAGPAAFTYANMFGAWSYEDPVAKRTYYATYQAGGSYPAVWAYWDYSGGFPGTLVRTANTCNLHSSTWTFGGGLATKDAAGNVLTYLLGSANDGSSASMEIARKTNVFADAAINVGSVTIPTSASGLTNWQLLREAYTRLFAHPDGRRVLFCNSWGAAAGDSLMRIWQ
jgi:hypothetical protein